MPLLSQSEIFLLASGLEKCRRRISFFEHGARFVDNALDFLSDLEMCEDQIILQKYDLSKKPLQIYQVFATVPDVVNPKEIAAAKKLRATWKKRIKLNRGK